MLLIGAIAALRRIMTAYTIADMDTAPFRICAREERAAKPRGIDSPEGLGDRLRTAAFAELQAIHAFSWAAARFVDAPAGLREAWLSQVADEQRHYALIIERMNDLGVDPGEKPVSNRLWLSLETCDDARDFCLKIAASEERGRLAGEKMAEYLTARDPDTASVFRRIVVDEVGHVALAERFYGWRPGQ